MTGFVAGRVVDGDFALALVVADLADGPRGKDIHHLAVVDERPIGVTGWVAFAGVVARDGRWRARHPNRSRRFWLG